MFLVGLQKATNWLAGVVNLPTYRLANDGIHRNISLYSLAGYDLTSTKMSNAMFLFAAYPDWQKWQTEEMKVFNVNANFDD